MRNVGRVEGEDTFPAWRLDLALGIARAGFGVGSAWVLIESHLLALLRVFHFLLRLWPGPVSARLASGAAAARRVDSVVRYGPLRRLMCARRVAVG